MIHDGVFPWIPHIFVSSICEQTILRKGRLHGSMRLNPIGELVSNPILIATVRVDGPCTAIEEIYS